MASAFHKKIQAILKEADLSKELTMDLKKELESHFYEKEHALRFSGLKDEEIGKKLIEDFGNDEILAKHLNFVHKKSFYSFIKSLMKNENKPSIFNSVFLFILLLFLYQNTLSDMHTSVVIAELSHYSGDFGYTSDHENQFKFFILFLLLIGSFTLMIRLFRGGALSQKIVSTFLGIIILLQIGLTYSFATTDTVLYNSTFKSSQPDDLTLIQDPYAYDEPEEAEWPIFINEQDGYQLNLPISYLAYRKDGTSDLAKNFSASSPRFEPKEGEIVAFGPAYSSDKERIDIEVFDTSNAPDKKENETLKGYYLRTQLGSKKYEIEEVNDNGFMSAEDSILFDTRVTKISLEKSIKMRNNILIKEFANRLYVFLYDANNPIHQDILNFHLPSIPEGKTNTVTFDDPSCPFTLQIPDYWKTIYPTENNELKGCKSLAFSFGNYPHLRARLMEGNLNSYFKGQGFEVKRMGETEWQQIPSRRVLLEKEGEKEASFALELKPEKWLIFQYHPYDKQTEKILNSLHIK